MSTSPRSACTVFLVDELGEFAAESIDLFGFFSFLPWWLCRLTEQSCPLCLDSNVETIYAAPFVYISALNERLRDLDNFDRTLVRLRLNPETLTSL